VLSSTPAWAVKLCTNKILQFFTTCILTVLRPPIHQLCCIACLGFTRLHDLDLWPLDYKTVSIELPVRLVWTFYVYFGLDLQASMAQIVYRVCVFTATARSELHKVLFLALSVTFLFVCEISWEPVNWFATISHGRHVLSLARTSLKVKVKASKVKVTRDNKNSSGDEIANENFYTVCPEGTRILWNNAK